MVQKMQMSDNSRFSVAPELQLQRSAFNQPTEVTTTFNAGDLIPLYWSEILPGDTVDMQQAMVTRMTTPIYPVMDNCNFDYFWFFVPNRLLWDDWEHFITGGLDAGVWDTPKTYEPPMISPTTQVKLSGGTVTTEFHGFPHKSLADYLGVPCDDNYTFSGSGSRSTFQVSALPFRAYAKIWNDWFRSSSLQDEVLIPKTGGWTSPTVGIKPDAGGMFTIRPDTTVYGGSLLKVNKYHDYFTSCLPEPQRGKPVGVPLRGTAPVVTGELPTYDNIMPYQSYQPLKWHYLDGTSIMPGAAATKQYASGSDGVGDIKGVAFNSASPNGGLIPANLMVDGAGTQNYLSVSINDLRSAAAVQHILEIDARSGSGRYIDLIKGHFGVTSPDARLQRAEYLGGSSIPINMDQVLQTSSTDNTSPQGNTAAYSVTGNASEPFRHSFVEHGILMCVGCVRHPHTYPQGLAKKWCRKTRYEYYWPSLANISEQPVYKYEICLDDTGNNPADGSPSIFGYQEAWADYRYMPRIVTSEMRPSYPQSLDVWHYADDYESQPSLSADWLQEGKSEIARTLAVQDQDQFLGNFAFRPKFYRVMPVYSVPGLDRI